MVNTRLKLTVEQYEAMVSKGAFDQVPQKIELIDGEIQAMNPAGPIHDDLVAYLTHWSVRNTDESRIQVRVLSGLRLAELNSRPEPDVSWVQANRPRGRHPEAHEVLLVMEVADTSLEIDRAVKADLYARAGIAEYWIVNCVDRLVHVYRHPSHSGYTELTTYRPGEFTTPLAEPQVQLDVGGLFDFD